MDLLLAVDLGLRPGLALKRGMHALLDGIPNLTRIVLEGGGPLAELWKRKAERRRHGPPAN